MGFLDAVMGNALKIDASKVAGEFGQILAACEVVEHAYQLIRDYAGDGRGYEVIEAPHGEQALGEGVGCAHGLVVLGLQYCSVCNV